MQSKNTSMQKFMEDICAKEGIESNYLSLHEWSVRRPVDFWIELIKFYNLEVTGDFSHAIDPTDFNGYHWFPNLKLNFAKNLLRNSDSDRIALKSVVEGKAVRELSYKQLYNEVARFQRSLKGLLLPGDVLACYMPNICETVISMLASSALGAQFTSTSSDFGVEGVVDRFGQSKPKVLVAAVAYQYNGKIYDQSDKIKRILEELPFIEKIVLVDFLDTGIKLEGEKFVTYKEFVSNEFSTVEFEEFPFSHPLYIMYSSGTTGKPKCIVHSAGGTLLQHVKELGLHSNLTEDKTIMYFTTCGWMMWNWLVSSLYFGSTIVLYEGSPGYPSPQEFTEIINSEKINIFGTSPKFLRALEDYLITGHKTLSHFRTLELMLSTGAPLLPEQFDFVDQHFKKGLHLSSICGGTDIIGCFMLGNPILPVKRGEIQCLGLGMDVGCFSEQGEESVESEGELVCKQSFPSRPLYFLNDADQKKIKAAYFERFPGVWHHGDFIKITEEKSVQVFGRSDATLNPGGVRIGTSEIYRQTETIHYLEDSICVGKQVEGDVEVHLYVKLRSGEELTQQRISEIKSIIRTNTTPRHVPKIVKAVSDIPYTRSGKKMEMAVTRLINGRALTNIEAVANPESLENWKEK